MIRLMAFAAFALALATSAQAMSPVPLHQSDSMITKVRHECGAGYHMVNGSCHRTAAAPERRQVCSWNAHSRWPLRQIIEALGDNWASASAGALLRSVASLAPGATRAQSPAKPSKDYSWSWPFVLPNVLWQPQPRSLAGAF